MSAIGVMRDSWGEIIRGVWIDTVGRLSHTHLLALSSLEVGMDQYLGRQRHLAGNSHAPVLRGQRE